MLETNNLVLRETVFEDCDYFAKWEADEEVTRYLSIDDDRTYKDVVTDFIMASDDRKWEQFTIVRKATGKPVGRIILSKINSRMDSLNIFRIYIADPKLRRIGLGEEALRRMLEYVFINLHTERVAMDHMKDDEAMLMLCRKIGFRDEGIMRHAAKKNGRYYDLYRMSLLRADYYDKLHVK